MGTMSEPCTEWRGALAASALGQSGEAQQLALAAHVEGCKACRNELSELQELARALPAADPDHLGDAPPLPPALGEIILARVGDERRATRRRRRLVVLPAGLVAAAVIVVVMVLASSGGVAARRVVLSGTSSVVASASLEGRPWGTEIRLEAEGLAPGQVQNVWLERADGSRVPAGTFTAVEGRQVHVTLAAALGRDKARAVGISGPDGSTVVRAALV